MTHEANNEFLPPNEALSFDEEAWYSDASSLADTIIDQLGTERGSGGGDFMDADWTDDVDKRFTLARRKTGDNTRYTLSVTDIFDSQKSSRFVFNANLRGLYKVDHGNGHMQEPLDSAEQRAWLCEKVSMYLRNAPVDFPELSAENTDTLDLELRMLIAAEDELVRNEILTRPDGDTSRDPVHGFYAALKYVQEKYGLSDELAKKVFDKVEEKIEKDRLDGQQA